MCTWSQGSPTLKLTAYLQIHGRTDFMADAIGHVAGERSLIVAGRHNSEFGSSITELDALAASDHAAAVQPGVGQGRAAGRRARENC